MKSLERKLILYVVLPVAIILSSIGIAGYFYIRGGLHSRWQEIAVLQMERAAQRLETRLNNSVNLIESFARAGHEPAAKEIQGWILKQLQGLEGVGQVRLTWQPSDKGGVKTARATPPEYFYPEPTEALGLRSDLLDEAGHHVGRIEVQIKFSTLMRDLLVSGWMHVNNACLMDGRGNFLARADSGEQGGARLRDGQDPIRSAILLETQAFGGDFPPL
jgi:adenylate cyclase